MKKLILAFSLIFSLSSCDSNKGRFELGVTGDYNGSQVFVLDTETGEVYFERRDGSWMSLGSPIDSVLTEK